jgi:hypothetical protein
MAKKPEAPEFALLGKPAKLLARKLGSTPDHTIKVETGKPGKGWLNLEDMGWIFIRELNIFGGYIITFTLTGWERWCRQVDVEEGTDPKDLPECEYE